MAASSMAPADFLLVHGSWHGSWAWELLAPRLPGAVRTVDLPSTGPDTASLGTFSDDVATIRKALADNVRPTVVVAHSAGGMAATEAVCGIPQVVGVVYIAAFVADAGQTLSELMPPGPPPPWWDMHPEEGYVDALHGRSVFYHDVPSDLAEACVKRLNHQSLSGHAAELTDTAWRHVPTSYIVCDNDPILPRGAQELMAGNAVRVHHLPSGHSPFLSMPDEVATLLAQESASFLEARDHSGSGRSSDRHVT